MAFIPTHSRTAARSLPRWNGKIPADGWLPIRGFEGVYEVSARGEVRNVKTGRALKQTAHNGRYLRVTLCAGGRRKHYMVHRLVASAFIRLPQPEDQVNHIDLNKYNNAVENLEWVSPEENIRHFHDAMRRVGKVGPAPRILSYQIAQRIRREYKGADATYKELAARYGVSRSCIWNILAGHSFAVPRKEEV